MAPRQIISPQCRIRKSAHRIWADPDQGLLKRLPADVRVLPRFPQLLQLLQNSPFQLAYHLLTMQHGFR